MCAAWAHLGFFCVIIGGTPYENQLKPALRQIYQKIQRVGVFHNVTKQKCKKVTEKAKKQNEKRTGNKKCCCILWLNQKRRNQRQHKNRP